ncbi:MAG: response regulator [Chloroflexi bacterium]|nr:response regulator [Chloroflexota bacterium]
MNSLIRFFVPPQFDDIEKNTQAYWLNRYLLAFSSAMLLLLVIIRPFTRFTGFEQIALLLGLIIPLGIAIFCIGLVHYGHVRLAAWIFSISGFVVLTILLIVFNGIRSSGAVGFFVIVAAVSLFIRGKTPLVFMGLSVLALTLIYGAEQNGLITTQYNTLATIDDLVILTLALVLNTLLLRQLIEGISHNAETVRRAATALLSTNEELQASQESLKQLHQELEVRVEQRTAELQIANTQLQHEIAERKRTEEVMQLAQKRESLGLMASGIAHDFNNLLVAMLAQTTLAMSKLPTDAPVRDHIQKAIFAAEKAAGLTRQMLAYSGGGQMEIEPTNINQMIRSNIHLFRAAIVKNVSLYTNLDSDLPLIEADRSQLQQVIMNLILNAAESVETTAGDVWVTTGRRMLTADDAHYWHWTGEALPVGEYTALTIQDTGLGMMSETRARIFDPFFTTKEHGQGLGLAAVLGIVRDHGGGLHVDSKPGEGTKFQLVFPVSLRKETAVSPKIYTPPANADGQLILVIDDEKPVREAVTDIMEMHNIDVITAVNGQDGISLFTQRKKDVQLVLLDMSMPGMNGIETLEELRQIDPDVHIILSSGYSQQQIANQVTVNSQVGFLPKPYDLNTLINKVWQYLPSSTSA